MSRKLAVLLAGTLVVSLVAAGFALTMNLGITPPTVPAPPAITGRTGSAQPVVHARASTLHKNAMNPPVGLGSTRTVVLPGPGPSPTPGPAESTRAPGSGQPTVEGTELRDADD